MKAFLTKGIVSFALMSSMAVAPVGATLIDRGLFNDGFGGSVNLIYDTDLDITWLGDGNFAQTSGFDADGLMNWTAANAWAASLTVGGFTDWRLPATLQPDSTCSAQTATLPPQGFGIGCTGSEMGHLFSAEGITPLLPAYFPTCRVSSIALKPSSHQIQHLRGHTLLARDNKLRPTKPTNFTLGPCVPVMCPPSPNPVRCCS